MLRLRFSYAQPAGPGALRQLLRRNGARKFSPASRSVLFVKLHGGCLVDPSLCVVVACILPVLDVHLCGLQVGLDARLIL